MLKQFPDVLSDAVNIAIDQTTRAAVHQWLGKIVSDGRRRCILLPLVKTLLNHRLKAGNMKHQCTLMTNFIGFLTTLYPVFSILSMLW